MANVTAGRIHIANVAISRTSLGSDQEGWSLHIKDLCLRPRFVYSVLGDNMSGKSTLLRMIAGKERLEDLEVQAAADPRTEVRVLDPAVPVCLLTHDDAMFAEISIWDNVRIARAYGPQRRPSEVRSSFDAFRRSSAVLAKRKPSEPLGNLSSGGKAIVKLARACCWAAEVILIDEVTANLDASNSAEFFNVLGHYLPPEATVVLVSHARRDHDYAANMASERGLNYQVIEINRRKNGQCFIDI